MSKPVSEMSRRECEFHQKILMKLKVMTMVKKLLKLEYSSDKCTDQRKKEITLHIQELTNDGNELIETAEVLLGHKLSRLIN